jgi:hypothetical protein
VALGATLRQREVNMTRLTQPGAAALAGSKRLPRGWWWLLSVVVLFALIFAGSTYAAYTYYYDQGYIDYPGQGRGDNTSYYRNFNDSCNQLGLRIHEINLRRREWKLAREYRQLRPVRLLEGTPWTILELWLQLCRVEVYER